MVWVVFDCGDFCGYVCFVVMKVYFVVVFFVFVVVKVDGDMIRV